MDAPRDAVWLGLGLALHLLTRPYESIFLVVSVILFFLPNIYNRSPRKLARALPVVVLAMLPAIALMLVQNKQVTGSWTTLPYVLSRYQYGVPTTFTTQPNPIPHRQLTPEQQLDYEVQVAVHGNRARRPSRSYLERFAFRVRFYRFFFFAPLYLALAAFLLSLREFRFVWVLLSVCIFGLGTNFYPYFYPHYIAAITCLFILMSMTGLERISRWTIHGWPVGHKAARLIVFLCVLHFLFWYGLHLFENQPFSTTCSISRPGTQSITAIRTGGLRSIAGSRRPQASNWSSSATGPNTSFRSGSTTRPISTPPASSGPVIWGPPRTRNCAATIPIGRRGCWNRTRALRG